VNDTRDDTTTAARRKKGTVANRAMKVGLEGLLAFLNTAENDQVNDMKDITMVAVRKKAATEATKEDRMNSALAVNEVVDTEVAKRAMALDVSNTEVVKMSMALDVSNTEVVKMSMALDVSNTELVKVNMAPDVSKVAMEAEETCHKVAGKYSHLWSLISANFN
jgi:hypothetical protein